MNIPLQEIKNTKNNSSARGCGNDEIENSCIEANSNPTTPSKSFVNCSATLDKAINKIRFEKNLKKQVEVTNHQAKKSFRNMVCCFLQGK
jgi:hypothetical protein